MILSFLAMCTGFGLDHEFVFRAKEAYETVAVAGTFNSWNNQADPMIVDADGRTWRRHISLSAGKHTYKFVLNSKTWILDPDAVKNEDDGNGHTNSVLMLLPAGYEHPALVGDGEITTSAISHSQSVPDLNLDRGRLSLTLSVRPGDVESVVVSVNGKTYATSILPVDELIEKHRCFIPWDGKSNLRYNFIIKDGAKVISFGPSGVGNSHQDSYFNLSAQNFKPVVVPSWVENSVFYQIFPDRFADGDKSNNPANVVPWGATPTYSNFMGGDLEGVEQNLPYLRELGANAIYLNPIFASPSNHGYETSNYRQVEPRFGGNAAFESLAASMHKAGMKIVIDGVFNHTATNFFAFSDICRNQAGSAYKDWYFLNKFPIEVKDKPNYEAWYGFPSMPKLHVENPEVEKYLLQTLEFWNNDVHLDGWRLDVANEVSPKFWRKFRAKLKAMNSQTWIVGEIWGDGTPWLGGDQFDATMNYLFRDVAIQCVAKNQGTASDFMGRLMRTYNLYAPQVSRNQLNLLGSHDTPRFLTECADDKGRAKLGALLQMTWVGAPSIYYGDELGMKGAADPDNRRGMEWNHANPQNDFLTYYRQLIAIRRSSKALLSGDPVPVLVDNSHDLIAYGRLVDRDVALVILNRSTQNQVAQFTLPPDLKSVLTRSVVDALSSKKFTLLADGTVNLTVPAQSGVILLPSR